MMRIGLGVHEGRTRRFVAGGTLLAVALALSSFGLAPAAAADGSADAADSADAAEGGDGDAEAHPLEIEASTLYVSPVTDVLPPTLTQSVPPAAVCVLQPELCPESTEPVRNLIVELFDRIQGNARDLPVQPVPPDSAAVSYLGGVPRYQTAIVFDPPPLPEGEDVMRYELTFAQSQPTYHFSSPAFRRVVLGAFEFISDRDEPQVLFEGIAAALAEDVIDTSEVMTFEACPLLEPVEPGGAPLASEASELPHVEEDDEQVVAVDCTLGGNGVYDAEEDLWRVDLAFTAQAWAAGELDNHGVLLRPTGAPNLAFGDADTSTVAQVVLDLTDVTVAVETAEPFVAGEFEQPPVDEETPIGGDDGFADDLPGDEAFDLDAGGDDLAAPLAAPDFPGGDLDEVPFDAEAPAVADGLGAEGEPELALDAQVARPVGTEPMTPWWVWLVAPLLLGGAYLTGSAVLAPAPVVATGGGGALTRMLAKHAPPGPGRV